jgi:hypothetical protein
MFTDSLYKILVIFYDYNQEKSEWRQYMYVIGHFNDNVSVWYDWVRVVHVQRQMKNVHLYHGENTLILFDELVMISAMC